MNRDRAAGKLALLEHETERRIADVGRRLDGAATRGGIVIAAALVIAAMPAGGTPGRWLPLGFAASAVFLAALAALVYRSVGDVPIEGLLKKIDAHTVETLSNEIFERKRLLLRSDEAAMTTRAIQLTLSYFALGLAAAAEILVHVIRVL